MDVHDIRQLGTSEIRRLLEKSEARLQDLPFGREGSEDRHAHLSGEIGELERTIMRCRTVIKERS